MTNTRVALVTGAARGQGLAIVRRLRRDGLRVVAADVLADDLHRECAALGDDVAPVVLDVTDEAGWTAALATAQERFGGLDVLVNNAGILGRAPLHEETAAQFERMWRVNCLGMFLGMRAAHPLLSRGDQPAIVNNLSNAAVRPFDRHAAYTSSKWAARGLSLTAAREYAEHGIRVNSVLPGPIDTPMHDPTTVERLSAASLLGRVGTPEDVANVVAMLASPDAGFVTGAEVLVDGGHALRIAH